MGWISNPLKPMSYTALSSTDVGCLQIVTAVLDKQRLQAEDESSVKQAFETLVLDRFVEQAAPANLPLPGPAVFAKLTVRREHFLPS